MNTPLSPEARHAAHILNSNPHATIAYHNADSTPTHPDITVGTLPGHTLAAPEIRCAGAATRLRLVTLATFRPLIAHIQITGVCIHHTRCHNEPIPGGVQCQPAGATWVGTYGMPCRAQLKNGNEIYAALSNAHVMVVASPRPDHPQHQPDTHAPAFAHLSAYAYPKPNADNLVDAAIADSLVDGKHTIDKTIFRLGPPAKLPIDLRQGDHVTKAGRTTSVTRARVLATGAAVRVGYGNFTALLIDQDVIQDTDGPFSAGGDSGSAILEASSLAPAALLFAGGGDLTIANPMRHVTSALNLLWPIFP